MLLVAYFLLHKDLRKPAYKNKNSKNRARDTEKDGESVGDDEAKLSWLPLLVCAKAGRVSACVCV